MDKFEELLAQLDKLLSDEHKGILVKLKNQHPIEDFETEEVLKIIKDIHLIFKEQENVKKELYLAMMNYIYNLSFYQEQENIGLLFDNIVHEALS